MFRDYRPQVCAGVFCRTGCGSHAFNPLLFYVGASHRDEARTSGKGEDWRKK